MWTLYSVWITELEVLFPRPPWILRPAFATAPKSWQWSTEVSRKVLGVSMVQSMKSVETTWSTF